MDFSEAAILSINKRDFMQPSRNRVLESRRKREVRHRSVGCRRVPAAAPAIAQGLDRLHRARVWIVRSGSHVVEHRCEHCERKWPCVAGVVRARAGANAGVRAGQAWQRFHGGAGVGA